MPPSNPLAGLLARVARPPALVAAARAGDLARVRLLTQRGGTDVDEAEARSGRTALHYAAEGSFDLIVGELLDRRASTVLRDAAGATPLLLAARAGCAGAARLLLSAARNRDPARGAALGMRDNEGMTPLLAAAAAGHTAIVEALLAAGADLGDTLENRVSAGHLAARGGHVATLAALVAGGLNVRADTLDRRGLLHEAAAHGHAACVSWLVAAGLDPDLRTLSDRATALELAIVGGCFSAVEVLKDVTRAPIAGPLAPPGAPAAPPVPRAEGPAAPWGYGGGGGSGGGLHGSGGGSGGGLYGSSAGGGAAHGHTVEPPRSTFGFGYGTVV
ncbi:hypothetical protein Rsub_07503 [Raphidocelis subcapitata]|uniref:Uncharacterized protein n=1 Tax=Raphidocelis subcapitata TaxID=307507 RepID=A0A2V0P7U7_9CHLO|nr:hypothetical protein Rsub_07503 [Raphidocelis subcapitata]|eukprot:GBF95002.1 hypothetical protein Rsub_07503 [Raphidocelis subcapitata]